MFGAIYFHAGYFAARCFGGRAGPAGDTIGEVFNLAGTFGNDIALGGTVAGPITLSGVMQTAVELDGQTKD